MRDLFILKSVALNNGVTGGKWDIDSLTEGGIAVCDQDGALVPDTAGAAVTADYLELYTKLPNGQLAKSVPIYKNEATYAVKAYVAPVAAKKSLGLGKTGGTGTLNLPSSITTADIISFAIRDLSKPYADETALDVYSIPVATGNVLTGTGASNVVSIAVAAVTAKSSAIVSAVAVSDGSKNDGILFTAKTAGKDFAVMIMAGIFQDADVCEFERLNDVYDATITTGDDAVVKNVSGHGTPAKITTLAKKADTRSGKTNSQVLGSYMWKYDSLVVSSSTYDQITLTHRVPQSDTLRHTVNPKQVFTIAGVASSAVITSLGKIFTAWTTAAVIPVVNNTAVFTYAENADAAGTVSVSVDDTDFTINVASGSTPTETALLVKNAIDGHAGLTCAVDAGEVTITKAAGITACYATVDIGATTVTAVVLSVV